MDAFYSHFSQAGAFIQHRLLSSASVGQQPDPPRLAAAPYKQQDISPVEYALDAVPDGPSYLAVSGFRFPMSDFEADHHHRYFAFSLQPRSSCFPYRCSLDVTYESRFWTASFESWRFLLQLLAADRSAIDFAVGSGITMAKLAQNKGEETSGKALRPFLDDFVQRLRNDGSETSGDSVLQKHIESVKQGFRKADSTIGNAGQEVIEAMRQSFQRMRPEMDFQSLGQYLEFRRDNVGADYVLAAVKFSISSSIHLVDPRLNRYLKLVKNHLAIVNDMASFDKQKRNFDEGFSSDMINTVDVVQRLFSLPDVDSAKTLAYTYQLQTEVWMREELQFLKDHAGLDAEQWRYLEATAGNAFFSMTSSRYGGDKARIRATY